MIYYIKLKKKLNKYILNYINNPNINIILLKFLNKEHNKIRCFIYLLKKNIIKNYILEIVYKNL